MSAHPTECRCVDCIHQLQHDSDRAQAQTLALMDLLGSQRRDLRQLQADMNATIDQLCERLGSVIGTEQKKAPKTARGFARMSPEERKRVASMGGKTSHGKGTAHKFTSEQGAEAGKKGGGHWRDNPDHLSEIGRKGGLAKKGYRKRPQPAADTPGEDSPRSPSDP